VLLGGVGLLTAGTLLAGLSGSYPLLVLGMAIAGTGNSVFHPSDFSILNARVSGPRLGYAYSAHGMAGSLGYAAAPVFSGSLGALFGWHAALIAAAGVGLAVFLLLLFQSPRFHMEKEKSVGGKTSFARDGPSAHGGAGAAVLPLLSRSTAGLAGLQSFSVTAMTVQYGVTAALASSALHRLMIGSASGIFFGGFVAARTLRHDLVAAAGLALERVLVFLIASGSIPGATLPAILALSGFCVGATGPSRDLIVRASTPPGRTGKV